MGTPSVPLAKEQDMGEREQAEAEAERRYPRWNTPGADHERHRAGYWGFLAGAGWAANPRPSAEAEPVEKGQG